jgi:uncharacterized DUF497 family protein
MSGLAGTAVGLIRSSLWQAQGSDGAHGADSPLHGRRPKSAVWSAPHRRLTGYVIYISSRMRFEFDPEKDDANRVRHGVSLSFGARVFEDADYLLIPTFREEDSEDRYKVIGMVDGKFWTAVHVRHGDAVRFISVRRSNDGEEKQYLA